MRYALFIFFLFLTPQAWGEGLPRVVSLDSCSDQLILALARDEQILALSTDSQGPFSYYKRRAQKFPQHHGTVEEILILKPDIVLSTGAGDPGLAKLLEDLGVKVIKTGLPDTIDGAIQDLSRVGEILGRSEKSQKMAKKSQGELEKLRTERPLNLRAMYISPSGITTGGGTFLDQVLTLAGLDNLLAQEGVNGWAVFDVEHFITQHPDVLITSFFDSKVGFSEGWRFSEHPAVQNAIEEVTIVDVPSRFLSCPAWFATEGAALIRAKLSAKKGQGR